MENDKRKQTINKTIHFLYDIEYVKHYNYYDELEAESFLKKSQNEDDKSAENETSRRCHENANEEYIEDDELPDILVDAENENLGKGYCSFSFVRVSTVFLFYNSGIFSHNK